MLRRAIHVVRSAVRQVGLDISRYPGPSSPVGRRMALLRHFAVDTVIDVGANVGQYALELRRLGYRGYIISFEPLPAAVARLRSRAAKDPSWRVIPVALGKRNGSATLHVASNSVSSSLLPMLQRHVDAAPASGYVDAIEVEVRRLDDIFDDIAGSARAPFLKLDVQGAEGDVLAGARRTLPRLVGLQVELSLVELYRGAPMFVEVISWLMAQGFTLMGLEPGFCNPKTGQLLQFDGLFFRPAAARTDK